MALKMERIKVEVSDSTEGETRTFKIILRVPNTDFQLADLLRQRGVISPIDWRAQAGCQSGDSKLFVRRRGAHLDPGKSLHGNTAGSQ
jgi:hypothetical protein